MSPASSIAPNTVRGRMWTMPLSPRQLIPGATASWIEDVERVRLKERDPPAGPDEARHGCEGRRQVVEVVEREESDGGVERTVQRPRQLEDVRTVEGDVVAARVERFEAVEQSRREIYALDGEPTLGERQRVAAHPAPDVEDVVARHKAGERDERVHLPLDVRRRSRPHCLLPRMLEVLDLEAVVLGDVGVTRTGHALAKHESQPLASGRIRAHTTDSPPPSSKPRAVPQSPRASSGVERRNGPCRPRDMAPTD
jgi:hypothetical protein